MKTGKIITLTILAAGAAFFALAGCSSDSTTPPQQAQSSPDAFRMYCGHLHDVQFRQALRNSWMRKPEPGETRVVTQNVQPDSIPRNFGVSARGMFLDMGKDTVEGLIKKGLSYGIDEAFGIQTAAQKQASEDNFINNSLVGIQHQLTIINNTLGEVAENQVNELKALSQDQTENLMDFADSTEQMVTNSDAKQTFTSSYDNFISKLETEAINNYQDLDFDRLCDPSQSDFISVFYGNLDQDNINSTILVNAYNVMVNVFGSEKANTGSGSWAASLNTGATNFMTNLKSPGSNAVANYYAAGSRFSQAAMTVANLLQQAYTVFAFTLQFASECPAVQSFYSTKDATPGNVYQDCEPCTDGPHCNDGMDCSGPSLIAQVTSDNLQDMMTKLNTNFKTTFAAFAETELEHAGSPFVAVNGNTSSYWDIGALLTGIGCNLEGDFVSNGCYPLVYVKDHKNNLDYLVAECKYNSNWTVFQLFIPTNNGAQQLTNIRYLTNFGLIGDIDVEKVPQALNLGQPGTILSAGTCSSHYKHICTCGFHDCYVAQSSIQVNSLYGAGSPAADGGPCKDWCGLEYRFITLLGFCEAEDSCSMPPQYAFSVTPNGHVFAGVISGTFCRNASVQTMYNAIADFGMMSLTETANVNGSILTITEDGTSIAGRGPSSNAANQNGNDCCNGYAEYGFGMETQNAPQPDASSYPICAKDATITLNFYNCDAEYLTGKVNNETSISVNLWQNVLDETTNKVTPTQISGPYTGTFGESYSTLTLEGTFTIQGASVQNPKWTRVSAVINSETVKIGTDAMQGLWEMGQTGEKVYITTNCNN